MRRRLSRVALAIDRRPSELRQPGTWAGQGGCLSEIGGGGVINGCYKSVNGQLRVVDPRPTGRGRLGAVRALPDRPHALLDASPSDGTRRA
jgi:hypothetical protein